MGEKVLQAVVIGNIKLVPVVQTCPLQIFVRYLKAERSYKVQPCARYRAGAGDISRILRYLRLNKYNIKVVNYYRLFIM